VRVRRSPGEETTAQNTDHDEGKRMNLLVCRLEAYAQNVIETLDLDKSKWKPCGLRDALSGHRFDRIVVMSCGELSDADRTWFDEELPLKLVRPPGDEVRYL
jgi:hypothetical protein